MLTPSPQWGGVVGENDGLEEFPSAILGIPSGQSLDPVSLNVQIGSSYYCSAANADLALFDGEWLILVFRCDIVSANYNESAFEYARCYFPNSTGYGSFRIARIHYVDGSGFSSSSGLSTTFGDGYISLNHLYGYNSPTTTALTKACIQLA